MAVIKIHETEYRAIKRPSYSSLKYFLDGVRHYFHMKDKPFLGNDATELGKVIHAKLQGLDQTIVVQDKLYKVLKDGSIGKYLDKQAMEEERQEILANNPEAVFITEDQIGILDAVEKHAKENKLIQLWQKEAIVEQAHIYEVNNVKLKGKLDWIHNGAIIDIKTTSKSIIPSSFKQIIRTSHYDLQAALYCEALNTDDYFIVAVETLPPHDVRVYKLSEEILEIGRNKMYKVLDLYKKYEIEKQDYTAFSDYEEI